MNLKKLSAAALAVVTAFGSAAALPRSLGLSATASAEETSDDWTYEINDNGSVTITEYVGVSGSLQIPSSIDGRIVSAIGDNAFYDNDLITSVTIPVGVTSIGESAFCYCDSLTSVVISGTVKSIGKDAFRSCKSLKSVNIPDGITTIHALTFYNTSIKTITIPKSVTYIGEGAFAGPLEKVNYTGSEEEWSEVEVLDYCTMNAAVKYNYAPAYVQPAPSEHALEVADVNGDNTINAKDVSDMLKMISGITPKNGKGDVNNDGSLNAKDITEMLKRTAMLPSLIDEL